MGLDRRAALKVLAGAGAAVAAGAASVADPGRRGLPPDAVGMLYDTTLCIGCKACVVACREANGLLPDSSGQPGRLWDAPTDLNGQTKNVIKLYRDGSHYSYMKVQCMHCVDPACAAACMIGALQKREHGVVTWDASRCVGCRYCQMACPFNIPKFEWRAVNPRIVKCEMCSHLLAKGEIPACCRVCPRQAVIFGRRDDLLAKAKQRIADNPGRYVNKVFGEHDGGGTQVLYLSHVPFERLGLPELGERPAPELATTVQHGIYKGFIAPAALYALLGAAVLRNRRASATTGVEADDEERPS